MTKLKSIALELLQKYKESETSVIWEYSGDIEKSEKYLDAEVAKYRELIDKYAEQEPSEDMTIAYLMGYYADKEPCEDAVDRSVAKTRIYLKYIGKPELCKEIFAILDELPPVQPKAKTGRWKAVENEEMKIIGYYCSKCDLPMETEQKTDFCPNCGARMVDEPKTKETLPNKEHFEKLAAHYNKGGAE